MLKAIFDNDENHTMEYEEIQIDSMSAIFNHARLHDCTHIALFLDGKLVGSGELRK